MDEDAALALHTSLPQNDPLIPPKFLVPPIPQAELFPSMPLEAFQAFTAYWNAQAQA